MAADVVTLVNGALQLLGAKRISSLTDDAPAARAANACLGDVRDEVLAAHPWTFAIARATLATVSGSPGYTEDRMTVIYAKPADFLRLLAVNVPGALIKLEGTRILSDTESLKIRYLYRNVDPTSYLPAFTSALQFRLAAQLAFTLTESTSKMRELLTAYDERLLPAAKSQDAQQGTPMPARQDEWETARFHGHRVIVYPGQDTWHTW